MISHIVDLVIAITAIITAIKAIRLARDAKRLASSAIVNVLSSRASRLEEAASARSSSLRRAHSTAAPCLDLSNFKSHADEAIIDLTKDSPNSSNSLK